MASSAPTPLNKIEQAHQMYRDGLYTEALGFYTEALSMAKTKHQKIALHSNRAACFLKLHDFKKAAQECTSVLELDHNHTGALMLRAQTLVTLKEYHSALFDVNRLIELNPDSEAYQNLQARLKTQLSLATIHESEAELEEEEEEEKDNNKRENAIPVIVQNLKAEPKIFKTPEKANSRRENSIPFIVQNLRAEPKVFKTLDIKKSSDLGKDQKAEPKRANAPEHSGKESSAQDSKGWQAIPKPKGHSALNYARWDRVEDDSSEDDDDDDNEDDEDSRPQYRFRVKTVGVRPVK